MSKVVGIVHRGTLRGIHPSESTRRGDYHRAMVSRNDTQTTPSRDAVRPTGSDAEAVSALFREHAPMIHALGLRLSGSASEADEIVQDTFLQAYRRWETFDGRSKPSTWLYTIAVRAWKRRHRGPLGRDRRMPSLEQVMPFHDPVSADLVDGEPSARIEHAETVARMQEAVASLPDAFRVPLLLKDLLELSVEETARVLGVKPETIKTRLHRARLALRQALLREVPTKPSPVPIFERQQCVDLLRAKLESMDRGEPFPRQRELICDRCRGVFEELDLTRRLCLELDGQTAKPRLEGLLATLERSLAADRPRTTSSRR